MRSHGDEITWEGYFDGQPICVISTVRLCLGNMAHFLTHSGARIGSRDWCLRGGHFVDLVVRSRFPLDRAQLVRLGELASTEDTRPVFVRRDGERLRDSIAVPPPA
jgi:hypothetical protein